MTPPLQRFKYCKRTRSFLPCVRVLFDSKSTHKEMQLLKDVKCKILVKFPHLMNRCLRYEYSTMDERMRYLTRDVIVLTAKQRDIADSFAFEKH